MAMTTSKPLTDIDFLPLIGSILEINNSERLRNAFGYAEGKTVKLARAKASCIYDVENDMILTSKITTYTTVKERSPLN